MSTPANQAANDENQAVIFFDLDGVLADFDLHADQQGKRTAEGKLKWDELDFKWWSTMPVCPGAKDFYETARTLGIVKFLTAPVLTPDCFAGKATWVQKFSSKGKFALKDLMIATDKQYIAKPNHILIDDRIKNIQEWEAAGGIGILHNGDFKETRKKLDLALAKIAITAKPGTSAAPKMAAPKKVNRTPQI